MQENGKGNIFRQSVPRWIKDSLDKVIILKNTVYWWYHNLKNTVYWWYHNLKNTVYWWYYKSGGFAYFAATAYVTIFVRKLQEDKYGLEKFVLVTRGRTGSTAVIDELSKIRQLHVFQELFILGDLAGVLDDCGKDGDYYSKELPPFDHWKPQAQWWLRLIPLCCRDARLAHKYLIWTAEFASRQGAQGMGWKLLSHQFKERPYIACLLKKHGYRVIYLRRNIVSQVLSGLVAKQRGIYNSLKKMSDERRFHIDIEELQSHVKIEDECVKIDCARLYVEGFNFVEVDYEEYCDSRDVFFDKIFNLLKMPLELPPPSDFVKVIEDLSLVIENYDEVKVYAAAINGAS